MHNLIGEDAENGAISSPADLSLHLYGKLEIRPDRKMGHVTRVFPETPSVLGPRPAATRRQSVRALTGNGALSIPPPRLDEAAALEGVWRDSSAG